MPKVSVIIPNYNHEQYLTERIDSVLNQTYQDFEVILMDDCSTDNSRSIIEQYRSHPKVSLVVFNEKNTGSTFKQWDKGIGLANGKYIWLAESDDWCEPNLLTYLVEGIEKDEQCVISFCQSYSIRDTNVITGVSRYEYLAELVDGDTFMREKMLLYNPIFNASMVLWRKEYFHQVSTGFMDYKLCGDWYFWMDLCRLGKVHVSGRVLNYFRKHDKDVSGEAMRSGLNYVETLKIINIFFQRGLISPKEYDKAYKLHFRAYYPVKSTLDANQRTQIDQLFKAPLTSKSLYYKFLASMYWRKIRSRK